MMLQHVKVLAVDQLVNERQETPTIAKAVTLEVSTEQAQKIMLATNIGKLSLILRQQGENEPATARRVNESDLGIAEIQHFPRAGCEQEPRGAGSGCENTRRPWRLCGASRAKNTMWSERNEVPAAIEARPPRL